MPPRYGLLAKCVSLRQELSGFQQILEMLSIVVAKIVLDDGFVVTREGKELSCWMLTEDECIKIGVVLYNYSQKSF
jgi:hypothetical protein